MNPQEKFSHRVYRRLRPFLYDLGLLRLARALFPVERRKQMAIGLGLAGFDTSSATGEIVPRWARGRPEHTHPMVVDGVNYVGDLRADMGLGEQGRLLTRAIRTTGIPISYYEQPYNFERRTNVPTEAEKRSQAPYNFTIVDINFPQFYEGVIDTPPMFFKEKYAIAFWAWELNRYAEGWYKNFRFTNEVWVVSTFVQDVISQVSPVPVIRMPLAVEVQTSEDTSRADFGIPEDRYVFLFSFSTTSTVARKNPFAVIEAFRRAFPESTRAGGPLLVMKAHHLDIYDAAGLVEPLRKAVASVSGVLIEDNMPRQRMYDLLSVCDCYVSLHRAEGFGLGMAEAMALGKPVIATGYSGNLDFTRAETSYLVRYALRPITEADHSYQPHLRIVYEPGYIWAEPDIDHAASLMRYVYEHQAEARATGARAQAFIQTHFSMPVIGQRVRDRLTAITKLGDFVRV